MFMIYFRLLLNHIQRLNCVVHVLEKKPTTIHQASSSLLEGRFLRLSCPFSDSESPLEARLSRNYCTVYYTLLSYYYYITHSTYKYNTLSSQNIIKTT